MKIVAIICNIVLFLFTCLVLVTDGLPREAAYIVFTLLALLIPILNVVVLFHIGAGDGWLSFHKKRKASEEERKVDALSSTSTVMKIVAIICNIVFLGFVCWALMDQYPHPKEDGVIAYAVLIVLTPILSVVAHLSKNQKGI